MLVERTTTAKRKVRPVPVAPGRTPSVTAVIPSYNYARFLTECVESILSQRGVSASVVIVDDGSTDETPQVTRALAADERVTVIRNTPNLGQLPSVNKGLALVDSEYVMKFDADDLLAPGALARATALLDAQPAVSFTYGRVDHFTQAPPARPDAAPSSWSIWPGAAWIANRCADGANVISQPEVVIRTAALRECGPVREDLKHTFDLHLWLKLAVVGDVGRVNGPAQGLYRVHDASMQRTIHSGVVLDLRGRLAAFEALFASDGDRIAGADVLHDRVRVALATAALDRAARAYDRGRPDSEPVDELVEFALETWAAAPELPHWAALERRRARGETAGARDPRSVAAALRRRWDERAAHRRWLRTGEWRR